MSTSTTVTQQGTGSSGHCNKSRKRNERHTDWEEINKSDIVYRWHVYRKYQQINTKKNPWKCNCEFWEYKANIQKTIAFLYIWAMNNWNLTLKKHHLH